jgi:hypothetical protein
MTRRRRPSGLDEPLFGGDWWPADTVRSLLLAPLGDQARCQNCQGTGKVTYDPRRGRRADQ